MSLKKFSKNTKRGFTLVELMIVVVLIAISVGVTGDVLTSLVRSYNKTQVTTEIEQQGNFVKLKLEKELRGARLVSSTSNRLSFTNSSGQQVSYEVTDGVILRKVGSGNSNPITSKTVPGGVSVSCTDECNPSCFVTVSSQGPTTVDVCFVMRQASTSSNLNSAFTGKTILRTTIVPRGTY
jgi:prepilin-type N-terminal cleavage/methylation domain-containing protein